MIAKLLKNGFAVLQISLMLLLAACGIWFFLKDSGTTIQDVLFCVGAVPIAVFSVGVFGEYFKRNETAGSPDRSVGRKTRHRGDSQEVAVPAAGFKSGFNWVLAGVALLLVCYFI